MATSTMVSYAFVFVTNRPVICICFLSVAFDDLYDEDEENTKK